MFCIMAPMISFMLSDFSFSSGRYRCLYQALDWNHDYTSLILHLLNSYVSQIRKKSTNWSHSEGFTLYRLSIHQRYCRITVKISSLWMHFFTVKSIWSFNSKNWQNKQSSDWPRIDSSVVWKTQGKQSTHAMSSG